MPCSNALTEADLAVFAPSARPLRAPYNPSVNCYDNSKNRVILGDAHEKSRSLADGSANLCVTAPPYYGMLDYATQEWREGGEEGCKHKLGLVASEVLRAKSSGGEQRCMHCGVVLVMDKQLGMEATQEEYEEKLVKVFHEVYRVLADDGALFVTLGDSFDEDKNLRGIPWSVASKMRDDGWKLRNDIIWYKSNPKPEPVKDRFTRAHDYTFMFTKNGKYYYDYDAVREPANSLTGGPIHGKHSVERGRQTSISTYDVNDGLRNPHTVQIAATQPQANHPAATPEKVVRPYIIAASRKGDVVLDPFAGSGTTLMVAKGLGRYYIGIELRPEHIKSIRARLERQQAPLF